MEKWKLGAAGLCLTVAACTNPGVSSKVDAAVVSLTTVENAYVNTCRAAPSLAICNDPMKAKIKDYDNKAFAAVKAAEKNEALLSLALAAIGDFTSATQAGR